LDSIFANPPRELHNIIISKIMMNNFPKIDKVAGFSQKPSLFKFPDNS
jgi:hypothetical protein